MPEIMKYNKGDEQFKVEDINFLREWITKQPHLPQNIHDIMLKRFLHCCNCSMEKTKVLIDSFYTVRSQAPEIFDDRDPSRKSIQNCLDNIDYIFLPNLTKKNHKILLYRLSNPDPDLFAFVDAVKTFYIVSDVRMLVEPDFPEGEVPIFDMAGLTWKHITKMHLPTLKKYMVYSQEVHPIKLKEIHILNAPPFLDKFMVLIRPFIKSEILSMIRTHLPNSTTIFDYVPRELLPNDYGGSAGKMCDLRVACSEQVMKNQEYIRDLDRWNLNESKRPAQNIKKDLFGMEGSFRTLSID